MNVGFPLGSGLAFLHSIFLSVFIQPGDNGVIFVAGLFGVVLGVSKKAIVLGLLEILIDDRLHIVVFFGLAEIDIVALPPGVKRLNGLRLQLGQLRLLI